MLFKERTALKEALNIVELLNIRKIFFSFSLSFDFVCSFVNYSNLAKQSIVHKLFKKFVCYQLEGKVVVAESCISNSKSYDKNRKKQKKKETILLKE